MLVLVANLSGVHPRVRPMTSMTIDGRENAERARGGEGGSGREGETQREGKGGGRG